MNDLSYDLIYNTKVANNAIFENNNFTQNTNVYPVSGGSYFYYGYGGNLTNSIFRKNSVSDVGIYSFYTTGNAGKSFNVTFEDSTFNRINTSSLIITATGGENITVRNNTFNEIRNGSVIVHLYGITRANATNNTFSNNGKNINALVYIYYSGGTSNSSISFNNFIDNTPTSYGGVTGIYLTDANTTEIFNNTWRNSTAYYSIQISGPSYYIKTYYNNASCVDGGGSHGIIYRQVYYGEIYNNTVSDCNFGILFHNGSRHNVGYDNKIESTAVGVYIIDDAVNNTFANSTLNGVGTSISVYRYDDRGNLPPANNTVYNVVINGSTGANIQGVNASNERGYNTFRDVIISNSAVANLIALTQNSTSLILTNVTSNVNGESVPAGSSYTRKWYVEASSNIAGTNLTLSNATGVLYTNSSPNFAKQTVTSYINNGGTRTNYSNYSITASADGYATNTTEINLTDNVDLSFTLVENIVPQVTINSPTASQTFTTSSVLLNVTLNENGTCLYSTNSGTTNNSMDTSDNLTFTKTLSSLSDRSYTANFYCNDSVGNRNDTINVSFSVAVPVAENPATSNSGSPIYSPTETNLEQGYSKSLGQNWEISFKSGSENHRLKVNKVYNQNKTATITISSSPQTKTLVVGEEWKVNLNEDNYYDLSIRLNDIKNNLANVTIKSINETISFEKEEVTETNNPIEQESSEEEKTKGINYLFYILIIILAVVVALSYFIYNKVKRRY
jgi:hypothetical protein